MPNSTYYLVYKQHSIVHFKMQLPGINYTQRLKKKQAKTKTQTNKQKPKHTDRLLDFHKIIPRDLYWSN